MSSGEDGEKSEEDGEGWSIWKRLREVMAKRRGYADFFGWDDRQVAEWGIASQLLEEFASDPGGPFRDLVSREVGADPPGLRNV
jgi:hypothetical protein